MTRIAVDGRDGAGKTTFAAALAEHLGLDADTVENVRLAGRLHDIGKIGVRESVLNKPGPLTDEEYAHIMTHPVVGWRLLQPLLDEMPMALRVVRSHHERLDGRGYPDGLVGAEIPLEARILSVCDAYEAMTADRPYRAAMSAQDAQQQLREGAGTQFDPTVVDAFLAVLASGA